MNPKQLHFGLWGLIGLVLLVGLGSFIIVQRTISQKVAKLQQLSGDVVIENQRLQRLRKLEEDYEAYEPLATKAKSILPDQKQQSEVVAQISTIARSNGMDLTGLTFDPTQGLPNERSQTQPGSIGGILVMPVRFEARSSYQQLQSLLREFERQLRFMRVSTLEVQRNQEGTIEFNMTLEVFLKSS
jgi:hypothetical protein